MKNAETRHRYYGFFAILFLAPLFLVLGVFTTYLAVSFVKRTYISPPWLTMKDIGVSKDALEFRVLPLVNPHPPPERADILLYGDSWTAGFGIPQGYSFAELIRDHFAGRYSVRIAAKNGGDLTRQYIAIQNTDYKPRLSVIFFNLNNDYETSMMESPYAVPDDYTLFNADTTDVVIKLRNEASRGVFKYSPDFSHMNRYFSRPNFIRDSFNNMLYRLGLKEDFWFNVHYFSEYFYSTNGGWKYIKRHDDARTERCAQDGYRLLNILFKNLHRRLGGKMVVVLFPPRECFGMDIFRRMYDVTAASKGISYGNLDYHQPRTRVTRMLEESGIRYVDVYPAMERAILDGKELFIPYNDHPNWLGHLVIYEAVIRDVEALIGELH
jgi:hypothetical protein